MATMGIDYGTRRVGIAFSYSDEIASPHSVIPNDGNLETLAGRIAALARELEAERFVLGLPTQRYRNRSIDRIEQFATLLRQRTCKEVLLWNESYSTTEADSKRRERGARGRTRKEQIDMEAAAIILQSWLDSKERLS
jgi:putative holliday junction resolvase